MSVRPVIAAAVVCVARVAVADRAVEVDVDGGAPVTATGIADALRVRVGPTGSPIRVHVATVLGGVVVSAAGATRVIALGDLTGPDAARLIALATLDLLDERETGASPAMTMPRVPVDASSSIERTTFALGAVGTASMWSDMLAGITVDAEVTRGRWLGAVDVGGATLVAGRLQLREAVVRVGAGIRFGVVDVRAGATVMPMDVSNGTGDQTVLVGAGASLRTRIAMSDAARFVIAAGFDVFATQTDYTIGTSMVTTPWIAPWLAAGFEVTP
ncbi:MAG TPA: hypothetical protein VGO00_21520 [Kofleriaceae bacterium]|nr:hypothetical protein [Kofleriaceae bacterium]